MEWDSLCVCGHMLHSHTLDEVINDNGDESVFVCNCKLCDCDQFREKKDADHK